MKTVSIIGGGAASFITADLLSSKFNVTIYEKGKTIGRKFLVAGKGGFNLAHNLTGNSLFQKYTPKGILTPALTQFGVNELRNWYTQMDVPTFVGSSNRVFPIKGISPATVLRKIKTKLSNQGVTLLLEHEFTGFTPEGIPLISKNNEITKLKSDIVIFNLGGGSWKVTGSNSEWLSYFNNAGIKTTPFQPSNCGLNVAWKPEISNFHVGKPLKNISVTHLATVQKGEALITEYGLEGNAIYPISARVRDSLNTDKRATIFLDLLPALDSQQIFQKIKNRKPSNFGKLLKLDSAKMAITKGYLTKDDFFDITQFSKKIKSIEIPINSLRPVEEAISTVGGVSTSSLTKDFQLKKLPNTYCIGEMVNWDAPTGGFLLQGCFSMGYFVAQSILATHSK